ETGVRGQKAAIQSFLSSLITPSHSYPTLTPDSRLLTPDSCPPIHPGPMRRQPGDLAPFDRRQTPFAAHFIHANHAVFQVRGCLLQAVAGIDRQRVLRREKQTPA